LPWSDQWTEGKEEYVIAMIEEAEDEPLLELAKHLGVASQLESTEEPQFWSASSPRIFLSHLASNRAEVAELAEELESYGIEAFVAHEDIAPTAEWQSEIESALATMDGLVALLAPGFKESNWCDQEVGVAIGRQIPIIAVRNSLDPYGFIGKYQAVQGAGKSADILASELFELLIQQPGIGAKITSALVQQLANSYSFQRSKDLVSMIESSPYLNIKHIASMQEAVDSNSQVSSSWGVPEKVEELAENVGS
jgi:hypothetical protein